MKNFSLLYPSQFSTPACRGVGRFSNPGGGSSNVVGIICPPPSGWNKIPWGAGADPASYVSGL